MILATVQNAGRSLYRGSLGLLSTGLAAGAGFGAAGAGRVPPLARGKRDVTDSFMLAFKIFFILLGSFGFGAGVVITTSRVLPMQFVSKHPAIDQPN
jgi:hypothetical protein